MRFCLGLLSFLTAACRTAPPPAPPARLEADLKFLADDALEGRGTPGRGLDVAALYLETQLRLAGVAPGLADGYRQWYRIGEYAPGETRVSVKIGGRPLASADYVFLNLGRDPATLPRELGLVQAGFGVVAEEKKVNDLDGLYLRCKAVIARKGASWPLDPQAVFGFDRAIGKLMAATTRGADVLMYVTPELAKAGDAEAALYQEMMSAPVGFVREPGLGRGGLVASALNPILMVTPQALNAALGADVEKVARGPLAQKVQIDLQAPIREGRASNVIGRIPGTDPAMLDQWIVLTAHYDHLGSHPVPPGQDGIWNGADDNASGATVILEMARRLAASPPKRSVLVLFVSGEERGIFGSAFYALRPVVPMDRVVVDLNVDMVGRSQGQVQGIAPASPQVFQKAVELGKMHGLQVVEDQQPSWRLSYLTDSYHFMRSAVPSIEFFTGLHADYHQPSDTADKIRYAEMSRILEVTSGLVRFYGDGAPKPEYRRPEWFITP